MNILQFYLKLFFLNSYIIWFFLILYWTRKIYSKFPNYFWILIYIYCIFLFCIFLKFFIIIPERIYFILEELFQLTSIVLLFILPLYSALKIIYLFFGKNDYKLKKTEKNLVVLWLILITAGILFLIITHHMLFVFKI